jgi:hypothetical protein
MFGACSHSAKFAALIHRGGLRLILPASYERAALPIVDEQLEEAGVRLAMGLNLSLR